MSDQDCMIKSIEKSKKLKKNIHQTDETITFSYNIIDNDKISETGASFIKQENLLKMKTFESDAQDVTVQNTFEINDTNSQRFERDINLSKSQYDITNNHLNISFRNVNKYYNFSSNCFAEDNTKIYQSVSAAKKKKNSNSKLKHYEHKKFPTSFIHEPSNPYSTDRSPKNCKEISRSQFIDEKKPEKSLWIPKNYCNSEKVKIKSSLTRSINSVGSQRSKKKPNMVKSFIAIEEKNPKN